MALEASPHQNTSNMNTGTVTTAHNNVPTTAPAAPHTTQKFTSPPTPPPPMQSPLSASPWVQHSQLTGHAAGVTKAVYVEGVGLVTSGADHAVLVWGLLGVRKHCDYHTKPVSDLRIVCTYDESISPTNSDMSSVVGQSPHNVAPSGGGGSANKRQATPQGKEGKDKEQPKVMSASKDGTIAFWNAISGQREDQFRTNHSQGIACAVSLPKGDVATAGSDGVLLWRRNARRWVQSGTRFGNHIECMAYAHPGMIITGGSTGSLTVWGLNTLPRQQLLGHTGAITAVVVLASGKIVSCGEDGIAMIWDLSESSPSSVPCVHKAPVRCAVEIPDGLFATGSRDGTISLWSVDGTFMVRWQAHSRPVTCLCFTSGGDLVSGSDDKSLMMWRPPTDNDRGQTRTPRGLHSANDYTHEMQTETERSESFMDHRGNADEGSDCTPPEVPSPLLPPGHQPASRRPSTYSRSGSVFDAAQGMTEAERLQMLLATVQEQRFQISALTRESNAMAGRVSVLEDTVRSLVHQNANLQTEVDALVTSNTNTRSGRPVTPQPGTDANPSQTPSTQPKPRAPKKRTFRDFFCGRRQRRAPARR